ncbi:MAG: cell division protein ZapB [Candidatus Acidiferrales bacterium]
MIHTRIRLSIALGIALTNVGIAIAQESKPVSDPQNIPNAILDQLVEQNQRLEKQNQHIVEQNQQLEKQNQQLMEQINVLRGAVAQPANVSEKGAEPASAQATGGVKVAQTAQSSRPNAQPSNPNQSDADDKTVFPESSNGNPAIFGEFNPGRGFTVGRGEYGELNLSGYVAARYLNQLPAEQTATDHLGRPITVMPRQDFQFHRVMLFSQGWLFSPKFQYTTFVWTVQDTNQVAVGGAVYYTFGNYMTLGMGWNAYPGTMSLQGSHPYWESYDRVMADEFFRPYFSQGLFAQGDLLPKLQYRWMIGNNNSNLDVPAAKLDRFLSGGFALTWLPTTGEFGPRGAFGDYEEHESLATRFNLAYTYSPEERQSPIGTPAGNTTLRLADSLNIFDTGAFVNGVTVERAHYQMVSASAGMKYHGFWLQGEGYGRKLDHFVADGKLPVGAVRDTGFYVQIADMIVPKRFELYGATSYVFSDYGHPKEFIVGGNYYPWNTRNIRLNTQLINVWHSPVSSTFGFYVGQITGQVFAFGVTALY